MNEAIDAFEGQLLSLKKAAKVLRTLSTEKKNSALRSLAALLKKNESQILAANQKDIDALSSDTKASFRDRLLLNPSRIDGLIESLEQVAREPDPVGEVTLQKTLPNGLDVKKQRSPIGTVLMVFESRPNVIIEAFSLAFKSGNTIALRGGSDSKFTSAVLYDLMTGALGEPAPVLGIKDYDRELVSHLLSRNDIFDLVVPRGGPGLIDLVCKKATMPIIKNDRGLCHVYVHSDADLEMATSIVQNAKIQRPGVCNSLETVLVHESIAAVFLPRLYELTSPHKLSWRADEISLKILKDQPLVSAAKSSDWDTEHLDLILNCRIVSGFDEATGHIEKHGSKHSEAIVTKDPKIAKKFQEDVDAAAVYWNASTRFTDGFELGLGGELGISTQKLHVRGPVGLKELTSERWIISGQGQTRS